MTRRQAWRRAGYAWCALASGIATIFGILGAIERDRS